MNWKEQAEKKGPEKNPPLPEGQQQLTIAKVVMGNKQGWFKSKSGDRQIMLVFTDNQEREAVQMYTLTEKAAFALAKVLEATGADLEAMTKDNLDITAFEKETFAVAQLEGKSLKADVKYEVSKTDGKSYARITPLGFASASLDDIPV